MMFSINPQRGESNHLTHCSWDNVTVTHTNMESIGLRDVMQDTFLTLLIYACGKGHGWLFGRHGDGDDKTA